MALSLTDKIIIRNATPKDVEAYRELRLEALKNHPDAFGQDYDDAATKNHEYWENALKFNSEEKALFFAVRGTQLIGMTGIYQIINKKARHTAAIWGVYVRPDWRGKHISEALIHACLEWAKEQRNIVIVKLAVVTHNIPAIRSYERLGFKTYGTDPKVIFHGGNYYDEYLMSIEIHS